MRVKNVVCLCQNKLVWYPQTWVRASPSPRGICALLTCKSPSEMLLPCNILVQKGAKWGGPPQRENEENKKEVCWQCLTIPPLLAFSSMPHLHKPLLSEVSTTASSHPHRVSESPEWHQISAGPQTASKTEVLCGQQGFRLPFESLAQNNVSFHLTLLCQYKAVWLGPAPHGTNVLAKNSLHSSHEAFKVF